MKKHLTQSVVCSLKPEEKPYEVFDMACAGLFVLVGKNKKTYYLKYDDANGKRRKHKIGEAEDVLTVAQAREVANELKVRLVRGEDIVVEKPKEQDTLGSFINDVYIPWVTENRKAGKGTAHILRSSFAWLFNEKTEGITPMMIEQWRTKRHSEGTKHASINRLMAALQSAINWGVTRELIERNPITKIKPLKEIDSEQKIRYLDTDERERLFAALGEREQGMRAARDGHNQWLTERGLDVMPDFGGEFTDYFKPLVLLSLYTGSRRGNVFGLQWRDIDFNSRFITFRADETKSGTAYRHYMSDTALAVLKTWRGQKPLTAPEALIFPSPKTGKRLDNCNSAWEALLSDANITSFRWHDMRHDYASRLVMSGVDLNVVRLQLGHADIKMTMRYAHLAPSAIAKVINAHDVFDRTALSMPD